MLIEVQLTALQQMILAYFQDQGKKRRSLVVTLSNECFPGLLVDGHVITV